MPGLVHAGRNGYLWMLERSATGISFIDAKPYVKQNVFTSIDPVTGRPEYDMEHKPGIGKPAIYCPSLWGGKDWPPAAYNPGTGYLYIPANENLCQHLVGEEVEYRPGQQYTGAQTVDFLDRRRRHPHRRAASLEPDARANACGRTNTSRRIGAP